MGENDPTAVPLASVNRQTIGGSSHLGMVGLFDQVRAVAAGGEQTSEPVVGAVAEASGDSAGGFDNAVGRLCRGLGYADYADARLARRRLLRGVVGIVAV